MAVTLPGEHMGVNIGLGNTQGYGRPMGMEKITVSTAVKTLDATKYRSGTANQVAAREAVITLEGAAGTNDIRFTLDGTTPVGGSTGHLLKAPGIVVLQGYENIAKFKAIRDGGSDGVIHVTYFL